MKLSDLQGILTGGDADIQSISFNSGSIGENCLYFCLKGSVDGHDYAIKAVQNGAVAVVCQKPLLDLDVSQLIVENSRATLAEASARLFDNPEKKLKMIGITGTNGKTTTSYILQSILSEHGLNTGIVGTNGAVYNDKHIDLSLTTPDPPQLFKILRDMADGGVTHVIMEVSAHALHLDKTQGITFDAAAFTNLTQDHLDYFNNMHDYAAAKARLFTPDYTKIAVINADDAFGVELIKANAVKTISYGCANPADAFAIDLKMSVNGLEYTLNLFDDVAKIKLSMAGRFNMYNSLCAATLAGALKIPIKAIAEGIRKFKRVEGRYNIINTTKCSVIIDFAHTEDGLKNIISSIREYAPRRVITVFGCGGDRDRTKRPLMGRTAALLSDFCVLTSDNPRTESPDAIISEIADGISGCGLKNYLSLSDRRQAIKYAISQAANGDIVLIAGKGAERYQEIKGVRHPYNDGEYVMELIEECRL